MIAPPQTLREGDLVLSVRYANGVRSRPQAVIRKVTWLPFPRLWRLDFTNAGSLWVGRPDQVVIDTRR